MHELTADHQDEYELLPGLARHPRVDLGPLRTPLHPMRRLGEKLGIDLWVKRDDCQPLGMGGNKVRQLEFYLGPAQAQGADTVLITGAVQSNFVRLCAAACRRLGWHPVLQLEDRVPKTDPNYLSSGNVLLDRLLGAEIHRFPEGEDEAAADANLDRLADRLRAAGRKPYVIHLGLEHPPLGGLGYALAAAETHLQCKALAWAPQHVVVPSGSGLTHGGFLCGARAIGWDVVVHGICVRRDAAQQWPRLRQRCSELDALLAQGAGVGDADILVDDACLAPGYGRLNESVHEAIRDAARLEAVLLDPVYSGRCLAGLIARVRSGEIAPGSSVLFVHTGGLPALFAYQSEFTESD